MSQSLSNAIIPPKLNRLARSFARLGWIGLWVQVTFGVLTVVFILYYIAFSSTPGVSRSGLPVIEYVTMANLLVLLFTIFWSYRYTRLARRMVDPERTPSDAQVRRIVWTGVTASTFGMLLSLLVLTLEVSALMFFFLRAPQGGIPVVQTGSESSYWVSSVDMVSLMVLSLTLFAELIVLIFSLWLLYRVTPGVPGIAAPVEPSSAPSQV